MSLSRKQRMIAAFLEAEKGYISFVAVRVKKPEFPKDEVIIKAIESIKEELEYMEKVYDEDLHHKYSQGVSIVDWAVGDTFAAIQHHIW